MYINAYKEMYIYRVCVCVCVCVVFCLLHMTVFTARAVKSLVSC